MYYYYYLACGPQCTGVTDERRNAPHVNITRRSAAVRGGNSRLDARIQIQFVNIINNKLSLVRSDTRRRRGRP